ncbi:hypothetical protein [Paludisphaera borealis]|uniref:Uncharacterized protein n=1 Tax=Paludisphaera borealis TaxID=1387353 RepID=A0A1U7CJW5_9BACT|nr:hypothetical protein [Paludisphaera borealis]APW59230.1 hypothetical protein BSF38_00645 [Paludisphaera borealis]
MNDPIDGHPNTSPPTAPGPAALTAEEQQRLRTLESQLKEYQRLQEATLEQKESERLRALAEKGQIEEALSQQRQAWEQKHAEALSRYSSLERQVYEERKTAAIAEAFHGRSFVGDSPEQKTAAAAMVRRLLQDEFETVRDASGALLVRDKVSGRPAAEAIRERLDSAQFAIFFAPSSRGGSGSDGTRAPALPHSVQPGSLESIASQFRDRQNQYQSFGLHPLS